MDLCNLLVKTVTGKITQSEIRYSVAKLWQENNFIHHLGSEQIPKYEIPGETRERYLASSSIRNYILYGGKQGEIGCLIVQAPPDQNFERDFSQLHVPLHTHGTDHIAVVLQGGGSFFVQKNIGNEPTIVYEEVQAGSIMFYPAEAAHTFFAGAEGILVASLQCEFENPESSHFAQLAPLEDFQWLSYLQYQKASFLSASAANS